MRLYTVQFQAQTMSSSQATTLFSLLSGAGKIIRPRRIVLSSTDTSVPTSQMLSFQARYLPATVTLGSGGAVPTPSRLDPGDSPASFTAHVNDTTPASTTGSALTLWSGGCHVYNGLDEANDDATGRGFGAAVIGPGEGWDFQILSLVSGTVHLSGTLYVEELGG